MTCHPRFGDRPFFPDPPYSLESNSTTLVISYYFYSNIIEFCSIQFKIVLFTRYDLQKFFFLNYKMPYI